MSKLIITRGLPASGKTTWARDWLKGDANRSRVNRDDLRLMLHNGFRGDLEQSVITKVQHQTVDSLLRAGRDVVVDDTNLKLRNARDLHKLAVQAGAEFEVNDSFLGVSYVECMARNERRDVSVRVPRRAIQEMHDRYRPDRGLAYPHLVDLGVEASSVQRPYVADGTKPAAIIVDIDGTLAQMDGRGPHDYHLVHTDRPRPAVIEAVRLAFEAGYVVIFLSGRPDSCVGPTTAWLQHHITNHVERNTSMGLLMRKAGDMRKDSIVKYELFDSYVRDRYNVRWVYDDRDQVVDMWRSIGLDCFQVNYGSF